MRVVVIGISGAGKSTLARALAEGLDAPHVELDALHWDAGWTPAAPDVFAARVAAATAGPAWVVDGNYSAVRPFLWGGATHLVWLDYERLPIMLRVVRRSVSRALGRQELWNGNREDWRSWWRASHPIRWAWSQWRGRRASLEAVLEGGAHGHLRVLRLRHPREADEAIGALLAEARRSGG
ncbi:adenylate kinase [Roseomonas sp. M0104]|uniref:Adenylate kinase n=1 Tax=Teichococcus coralli TaxID=2545983 RepID=A0A845B6C6_9PROT|nr:adenylate kinase [Pseudoroseomonas coralli]MXP63183.1 adenylate kinase [Pseudoroseomonas coralli]